MDIENSSNQNKHSIKSIKNNYYLTKNKLDKFELNQKNRLSSLIKLLKRVKIF